MKKFVKFFIIIFISLAVFICCDMVFFNCLAKKDFKAALSSKKYIDSELSFPEYFIKLMPISLEYEELQKIFRPVMNSDSKEDSIIIFGCSYAYGYIFNNDQTISYILSKYSKRPIYNRAMNGWGIQHALYQLENKNLLTDIKTKPKYIFYVLMGSNAHYERLYLTVFPDVTSTYYYFGYKLKNNELVERKPIFNLYYNFAIFRYIQNQFIKTFLIRRNLDKHNYDFFILHFKKINELIKARWGVDGKYPQLIILNFENNSPEHWAGELEKDGIKVINIADTINIYGLDDLNLGLFEPEINPHPNGKLWKLLIPKLKEMYPDL